MRSRHAMACVALAACASGCAPAGRPQLPRFDAPSVSALYATRLAERRTRAVVAEGDYSAWVHRPSKADPPGFTLRSRLVAPNAFRLRIDALLGNAIDLSGHADTLVIDAPALNISAITDAAGDRSRRQDISGWVCRALGATWTPPAGAWAEGAAADSGWRLRWTEAEDSLEMVVSQTGLPRWIHVHPAGGAVITLRYERWSSWNGVMWPSRLVGGDASGRMTITLQPQSMLLKATDTDRHLPPRTPHGAVRLSRGRLLAWVSRLAGEASPDSTGIGHP